MRRSTVHATRRAGSRWSHRWRAGAAATITSLAVIAGTLVASAAPAQAADLVHQSDVATGPRSTTVLAASGAVVVARAQETSTAGLTRWSADSGATWQEWDEEFTPTRPAAYVAEGKAVWYDLTDTGDRFVRVVDLTALGGTGAVASYPVAEQPRAVTDTQLVMGEPGAPFQLVDPTGATPAAPIRLDGSSSPAKATHPTTSWVLRPAGLLAVTAWSARTGGRSSYTDIDPVGPGGGFGPRPFRVSGYVPYVGLVWKTNAAGGIALIEYLRLSGRYLTWCTREWNPLSGSLKAAVCRRVGTTSRTARISAVRYGAVVGITINGSERVWRNNRLVGVRTLRGHVLSFTGVGDPASVLVRADRGIGGAIYRVAASNGALTRAFNYFTGRVPPSALDLTHTRLAGLDGRARQQGWIRAVDDDGVAAVATASDLAGATLGLQVSGSRQVQRTAKGVALSDRGVQKATSAAVSALTDASGPYTLVTRSGKTVVLGPAGTVVARASRAGNAIVAIFGSIVVEQNAARTAILVRELTGRPGFPVSATVPGAGAGWRLNRVLVHGDHVVVGVSYGSFRYTYAFNWAARSWTEAGDTSPVALGDGVAALYDNTRSALALWRLTEDYDRTRAGSKAIEDADTSVAPSFDGVSRLVYSTGTSLKVIDLHSWDGVDLSGTTGPRVLGAIVPTSYEINTPGGWNLAIDVSRPVDPGVVEIVKAAGTAAAEVIARLPVDDNGDGSIRVTWNGAKLVDPDGEGPEPAAMADGLSPETLVADGRYTWRYLASGTDSTPVTPINGDAAARPGGTITVFTAPIRTPRPRISGTLAVGRKLTASHAWSPAGLVYSYQWFANRVPVTAVVPGGRSYRLLPADRGKTITVRVTATNRRYSPTTTTGNTAAQASTATRRIGYGTLGTVAPRLPAGTPRVGRAIQADPGTWSPSTATFRYAWYRVNGNGRATLIRGATTASYTPVAADLRYRLRVIVTGSAPGYRNAARRSATTARVAVGALSAPAPSLPAAAPEVGQEIVPDYPAWGPGTVALSYAWYRVTGGRATAIPGATAPTYTPVDADRGSVLRLAVRGTKAGFATAVVTADTAGPVA